jgi:hypothetical protein
MANKYDDIDRYLEEADAEVVPEEFISSACIVTVDGDEYTVSIDEVAEILEAGSFEDQGIAHIRAVIDMEQVKGWVIEVTEEILSSIR